jgi:hypothetical protein
MSAKGDYYPVGPNMFVPNMQYAADVFLEGKLFVDLTPNFAPLTASATAFLSAQSIATAGNTSTLLSASTEAQMGKFGRCLQYVASGAATSTVTATGFDYLGQPFIETITLNGTTIVNGTKAFRRVSNIAWTLTGGTTINVGYRDCFGLPYASQGDSVDYTSSVRSAVQGTFVVRVAAQTATSGDPRGTFVPNSAANGTNRYQMTYEPYRAALYGARHVTS